MTDLQALKREAENTGAAFDDACRPHYCDGRWGAYRAMERGDKVPAAVNSALNAYHHANHAYYLARDGARGFLGGRGL